MPVTIRSVLLFKLCLTLVCVLPRQLSDGISDLAAHRVVGLLGKASKQLRADSISLGLSEGEKEVLSLTCSGLARFRGLAPEDDGSKCPSLARYECLCASPLFTPFTH